MLRPHANQSARSHPSQTASFDQDCSFILVQFLLCSLQMSSLALEKHSEFHYSSCSVQFSAIIKRIVIQPKKLWKATASFFFVLFCFL